MKNEEVSSTMSRLRKCRLAAKRLFDRLVVRIYRLKHPRYAGGDECGHRYEFRHGNNKTLVSVKVFDTPYPEADEQYDLAVCHYTGALITRKEAIVLGAVTPRVSISYLCHPLAGNARKRSVRCFQEYEQNCNTCRHLRRVEFDRAYWRPSGLMPGECLNEARMPLYPREGNKILFAPDDSMMQTCYEGRNGA